MSQSLRSDTIRYTFALLLSRAVSVIFLLALPTFLSASDYGVLGLVTLATALLSPLLTLELGQGLGRYYPTASPEEQQRLLRSSLSVALLGIGAVLLLSLIFSGPLTRALIGEARYEPAFCAGMLFCLGNILFMFLQNLLRWQFRSGAFLLVNGVGALLMLGLGLGFGIMFRDQLTGVIVGQAIAVGLALLVTGTLLRGDLRLGLDLPALTRMLRFSLPLVFASLTLFASAYASRVVLQDLSTLAAVGHFTWATQVASLPILLLLGIQASITPFVMRNHADPACPPLLARSLELVIASILSGSLGLGLAAPVLVKAAGIDSYLEAARMVLPLGPAALMLNLYVFAPGFAIAERSDLQFFVSLAGAMSAVVLNYLLVGAVGAGGAVIASLASSSIFFLLWFGASQRLYPIPIRVTRLALFALGFAACGWLGTAAALTGLRGLALAVGLTLLLIVAAFALRLVSLGQLSDIIRPARKMGGA